MKATFTYILEIYVLAGRKGQGFTLEHVLYAQKIAPGEGE